MYIPIQDHWLSRKMSKAMASVSKNILKYEITVMIMPSYNKVVIYETNEGAYINSDTKKNYQTLHNESTGPKIESSLNHEYSSVLNTMFFVGVFLLLLFYFLFFENTRLIRIISITRTGPKKK